MIEGLKSQKQRYRHQRQRNSEVGEGNHCAVGSKNTWANKADGLPDHVAFEVWGEW